MTAIRASVADIMNGDFGDDDGPRVISPKGVELRRVALIGNIVDQVTGNNNYASITIDDGTETIRVKAWGTEGDMLQKISGNIMALVIGKVREYQGEIYIGPEIVREIDDPNLITLHNFERQLAILRLGGKEHTKTQADIDGGELMSYDTSVETKKKAKGSTSLGNLASEILDYIKASSPEGGVRIEDIAKHFEKKGIESVKIQLELIVLVDEEKIIEEEVGLYRAIV